MRSLLFVPGDSERKLFKSLQSGADAVVIDLEDSVAPAHKSEARAMTTSFLNENAESKSTPSYYVRINGLESNYWQQDIEQVITKGLKGVIQPKTRSGNDVALLGSKMDECETNAGLEANSAEIIIIATETPVSLLNMNSYIGCSKRLTGISWGAEDLCTALGGNSKIDDKGDYTPPIQLARSLCLYTAHAAKVQAIDTVFTDFKDLEGLRQNAEEAARDGFTGKEAVHPAQIEIINEAFTPSDREIEEAQSIIAAFEETSGKGVIAMHDQMMDRPHLIQARRVLERAELIVAKDKTE